MLNRGRGYRFRERAINLGARIFLPKIAGPVRSETRDAAFVGEGAGGEPEHIRIVDRGSDSTIVSFSNAALLHAGQPTRAFEGLFTRHGQSHNLVFMRDVHRSAYHYTPTGAPTGLAFHEAELRRTLADLGSKRVVGIGDSGGASAAIYFGVRCGFDQVIAFSPPYPLRHWVRPAAQLRAYFNLPLLFREPGAYWEHVLISVLTPLFVYLPLGVRCGFRNIFDPIADYCAAQQRPELTVFYGEGSKAEAKIVAPLKGLSDVSIRPQPTASHFCMVPLARSGRLGATIMDIIDGPAANGDAAVVEAGQGS